MSKNDNMREIIRMIESNINLNKPIKGGVTRLMASVYLDDIDAVKKLLRNGADINAVDDLNQNALMISIFAKNRNMSEYLIRKGINVNIIDHAGRTALMFASSMGDEFIVKLLTEKGANVKYRAYDLEYNAFIFAALNNHTGILNILNSIFARKDSNGNNNLLILVNQENENHPSLRTIEFILDNKFVDINERNKFGETALMIASYNGKDGIVNTLLEHGATMELEDDEGKTALYHAIIGDNLSTVELLISRGANPNFSGNLGETLSDITDNDEIINYLQNYIL